MPRTVRSLAVGAALGALLVAGCQASPTPTTPQATPAPTSSLPSLAPTSATPTQAVTATPTPTPTKATSPSAPSKPSEPPTQAPSGNPLSGMVTAAGASGRPSQGGARLKPTASGPLSGRVIVVDPGHNGNYISSLLTRPVPAGNGTTKACNTSGTAANDGGSEHAINWEVGVRLVGLLRAKGATVVLTRPSDSGVGPCVNERAAIANRIPADLVLSIHGDGASASARGFHVIVSTTMAGGSALESSSLSVAKRLVGQLESRTPLPRSTYIGGGTAISRRSDIAGMNLLSRSPGVMLEMGNMRNSADWAYLKTSAAKDAIARAMAETAVASLG